MSKYVMRIVGIPNEEPYRQTIYVRSCDVNAKNGRGAVVVTTHQDRARRFDSITDVFEYYQRQSDIVPLRADGKPNRPLTAYTIATERVDE